jgi:hypothetical protein
VTRGHLRGRRVLVARPPVRYWDVIEEIVVDCPCCGEHVALDVDTTAGPEQSYFEDCPVCCRPMEVFVRSRPGEVLSISVSAD